MGRGKSSSRGGSNVSGVAREARTLTKKIDDAEWSRPGTLSNNVRFDQLTVDGVGLANIYSEVDAGGHQYFELDVFGNRDRVNFTNLQLPRTMNEVKEFAKNELKKMYRIEI